MATLSFQAGERISEFVQQELERQEGNNLRLSIVEVRHDLQDCEIEVRLVFAIDPYREEGTL